MLSPKFPLLFSLLFLLIISCYSQESQEESEENCDIACAESIVQDTVNGVTLYFAACCFNPCQDCSTIPSSPACVYSPGSFYTTDNICQLCQQSQNGLYYAPEACPGGISSGGGEEEEDNCEVNCSEIRTTETVNGEELTFQPCCVSPCTDCSTEESSSVCVAGDNSYYTSTNICQECQKNSGLMFAPQACPGGATTEEENNCKAIACSEARMVEDVNDVELTFQPCCFSPCDNCDTHQANSVCVSRQNVYYTVSHICYECKKYPNIYYANQACPEEGVILEEHLLEEEMVCFEEEGDILIIPDEGEEGVGVQSRKASETPRFSYHYSSPFAAGAENLEL